MNDRTITPKDNLRKLINTDTLPLEHSDIVEKVESFEKQVAEPIPPIQDDKTNGIWIDFIAEIDGFARTIVPVRKGEIEPYADAVKDLNGFFFGLSSEDKKQEPGRLQIARQAAYAAVLDYANRKEAKRRAEFKAQQEAAEREAAAARKRQEIEDEKRRKAEKEGRTRAATNADFRAADAAAHADVAEMKATEAGLMANAAPGELTRTVTDGGTRAKTDVEWHYTIPDIKAVKGAALWSYVTKAAKEAAIAAYVRENAPKQIAEGETWQPIPGVVFTATRKLKVGRR